MVYLAIILKIILAIAGFTTAFLSVFKRTIDDQKRLTKHGKISIACVCVTLSIAISNEFLNAYKEAKSAADKRTSEGRVIDIQKELDNTLAEDKKLDEQYQLQMAEAKINQAKLEETQKTMKKMIEEIDKHASDPTVKKIVGELKILSNKDIAITGGKLVTVYDMMNDVHSDLNDVRLLIVSSQSELSNIKNEINNVKSEIEIVQKEVNIVKGLIPLKKIEKDAEIIAVETTDE